jgi:uncharacterized small protein (DUF1192 family)
VEVIMRKIFEDDNVIKKHQEKIENKNLKKKIKELEDRIKALEDKKK